METHMSRSSKSAIAARQEAEKLLPPQPPPRSNYEQEVAILERQHRAQDEKTARLRALRLAKEAAEAQGQGAPAPIKQRKRSPATTS
jgi:hypothetical protein